MTLSNDEYESDERKRNNDDDEKKKKKSYWIVNVIVTPIEFMLLFLRFLNLLVKFVPLYMSYPVFMRSENEFFINIWFMWCLYCFRNSGPVMMKVGQWISTRPDQFSERICKNLSVLHSKGYSHSFSSTKKTIKESFGKEIDEIFDSFEKKPVGVGAIAQVYKAKLKEEYRVNEQLKKNPYVAVKVRHPNVIHMMNKDLKIFRVIAMILGRQAQYQWLELDRQWVNFSEYLKKQVNLKNEGINLEIFNKNFRDFEQIVFPRVVKGLVSEKVLCQTFEEGMEIQEFVSKKDTHNVRIRKRIAQLGIIVFLKMLIVDNFLHADLHPGNIFVRLELNEKENSIEPRLVLFDVGLVVRLNRSERYQCYDILTNVALKDGKSAAELIIGDTKKYSKYFDDKKKVLKYSEMKEEEREHIKGFVKELHKVIVEIVDKPVGSIRVANVFQKLLEYCREFQISVRDYVVNVSLGMIISEGLARQLHPKVKFLSVARQLLVLSPEMRKKFFYNSFESLKKLKFGKSEYKKYQ